MLIDLTRAPSRPVRTILALWRLTAFSVLALAVTLWPQVSTAEEGTADPRAAEIAAATLEAMGGADAWAATRFLRFEFFGNRLHHWDRFTGRHRLAGTTREGESYVVLQNVHDRTGKVWVEGEPVTGDDAAKWLEMAYGAWINDTYWLIMPYKLRDPGVTLTYDGEAEIDGKPHDTLELTFAGVGLTPGDTYWAWIDRETGLMSRWAYHLEGWEADREPTAWDWRGWERHGGILLAPTRAQVGGDRVAELGEIAVFDHLPDAVFESPAAVE